MKEKVFTEKELIKVLDLMSKLNVKQKQIVIENYKKMDMELKIPYLITSIIYKMI